MSQKQFDYLIVGGGSSGAVLARRLADNPQVSVCLIEGGPAYENDPKVLLLKESLALVGDETYDYDYPIAEQTRGNSALRMSRAKMLGGCSSHNDSWALRAPHEDMDRWQALGATGWGSGGTSAHFDRVFDEMRVHPVTQDSELSNAFVQAAGELDIPLVDSTKGDFVEGISWVSMNEENGVRVSTAVAYLYPLAELPSNLTLMLETMASKVEFEDGRAVAVKTDRGEVRAEKEIILSAGAIDTPKLLLLSGIGPATHLTEHDIEVVVDSPGVGSNLQDHIETPLTWAASRDAGPSINGLDLGIYASVNGHESFDLQATIGHFTYWLWAPPFDELRRPERAFTFAPNTARPQSRGTVRLASADPSVKPIVDPAYFTDPGNDDERVLIEGIRLGRRLAQTTALKDWIVEEISPGPGLQTDEELRAYVRKFSNTVYHPTCTARMGTDDDPMAVLDPSLRVRGVTGLRVADASVFPELVRVNPNMTAVMVGSKAAELIEENHR